MAARSKPAMSFTLGRWGRLSQKDGNHELHETSEEAGIYSLRIMQGSGLSMPILILKGL